MADQITKAIKPSELEKKTDDGAAQKATPRFIDGDRKGDQYDLLYPIEFDDVEYRTVKMSRMTGKDFMKLKKLLAVGLDEEIAILSIITGLPVEVAETLDTDDFIALGEKVQGFIPARFLTEGGPDSGTGQNTPAS